MSHTRACLLLDSTAVPMTLRSGASLRVSWDPCCLHEPSHQEPPIPKAWVKVGEAGGAVLITQPFCLSRVPTSERTTIHKNLILSLASAEGFLMTSEWAKTNKVGNQQVTCKLWDQESMRSLSRSPPLLPAGGFPEKEDTYGTNGRDQPLTLLWMRIPSMTMRSG